ncbi:nucleotidyltransferase family protein [Providencia vermicola]|uniref:nucleotidyltransferase family protein n=1 Tax=Providencia vermicola TaxID=333965 RepID=UPI001CEDAAAB|nr:nucleotidyltransferase family protein [Providencia vermicola]
MSSKWKNILLPSSATILDALEVINREGLRIALVADENHGLIGVVADGDIRRGLLSNLALTDCVTKVMNTNPITAEIDASKEELAELMRTKEILSIPLLQNGKIVGLEILQNALSKPKYQNPVFIMAGGFGTRLKPLTNSCPKPMLKIGNKPMLETIIRHFIKAGFSNFYISTHYMPEVIQNYFGDGEKLGIKIQYVYEDKPLGTGGALGLLPENLPQDLPLIMINGDILTTIDYHKLLKFHNDNQADATMCVREYSYQIPYGVVNSEGHKITSMVEKPNYQYHVNAGIYVVSPQVIKSVVKNNYIDMPTLLSQHIENKKKILMYPIYEYWLDIGRLDDFNKAQIDIYNLGIGS